MHKFQILSLSKIDSSPEVNGWLGQFEDGERIIAKQLLLRLKFVGRDIFAGWLKHSLLEFSKNDKHAVFTIRKLDEDDQNNDSYFDEAGEIVKRPAGPQGSEDFINAEIANLMKDKSLGAILFNHPSLDIMRQNRIRHVVLVDDSIGSGSRVAGFIRSMLNHKTFRSWWNFGWIKLTIISYARNLAAEEFIYSSLSNKSTPNRKFKAKDKIKFKSLYVYKKDWLKQAWGESYKELKNLCEEKTVISKNYRLGYKNSFSNIVFLHSVPNNIPGILWFQSSQWQALMPYRSMPTWLISLLELSENKVNASGKKVNALTPELLELLMLVKTGVRSKRILALRLNTDLCYAQALIDQAVHLGLISANNRLTDYSLSLLRKEKAKLLVEEFNYDLYIPDSWCVG